MLKQKKRGYTNLGNRIYTCNKEAKSLLCPKIKFKTDTVLHTMKENKDFQNFQYSEFIKNINQQQTQNSQSFLC